MQFSLIFPSTPNRVILLHLQVVRWPDTTKQVERHEAGSLSIGWRHLQQRPEHYEQHQVLYTSLSLLQRLFESVVEAMNATAPPRAWQPCGKQALSSAAESACATASTSRQLPTSTSGRVLDAVLRGRQSYSAPANLAGPQLKEFRRQMGARWQNLEERLVLASNSLWTTGAGQV